MEQQLKELASKLSASPIMAARQTAAPATQKAAEQKTAKPEQPSQSKRKSLAQRIADLEAREEQLKQQKRKLLSEQSKKEKAARTHRLCEIGGIVEKVYGKPLDTIAKREAFQDWLMKVMHKSV